MHVALPESAMDLELAKERPGYFADTGIQALLREMERYGYRNYHVDGLKRQILLALWQILKGRIYLGR